MQEIIKMKNREQLLKTINNLTDEELALLIATGLDCSKCPVSPKCYNKVVCNKNSFAFLRKTGNYH